MLISKFERIAQRRKWTAQKRLDRLFDCLSETALEYANRCQGQNDYMQLRAELARRFDLRDTPVAAGQKLHTIPQKEDEGLEVFCSGFCQSVWMAFHRLTQSLCSMLQPRHS